MNEREPPITPEGREAFKQLLIDVMREHNFSSQIKFAQFISERSGLEFRENRVQRLMKGHYDDATISLLLPIVKARVLKLPNGEFYTFDDVVDLLCGILDPATGERKQNGNHAGSNGSN